MAGSLRAFPLVFAVLAALAFVLASLTALSFVFAILLARRHVLAVLAALHRRRRAITAGAGVGRKNRRSAAESQQDRQRHYDQQMLSLQSLLSFE